MNRPRPTPRPTACPTCGLVADNAIVVRGEMTGVGTFVCTEGHLYSVSWIEAA